MVVQHLPAVEEMVLNELKKKPGEWFEHYDKRLLSVGSPKYSNKSIGWALWSLEKKGLINKVRKGRKVHFYFPQEQETNGSKARPRNERVRYTVTYTKDEDGYIVASVPALPGCHSQGRTKDEARKNIQEAMRGYLASLRHRGEAIPKEEVEQVEVAA